MQRTTYQRRSSQLEVLLLGQRTLALRSRIRENSGDLRYPVDRNLTISATRCAVQLPCSIALVIAVTACLFQPLAVFGQQQIDPAKVLGHNECAECHKSEVAAWQQSSHATKSFTMLTTNPKAKDFAAKLGITAAQLTTTSVCTTCHGTQQELNGQVMALGGNSCEACHGAAGPKTGGAGELGWFRVHSYYGQDIKDRAKESEEHAQQRIAYCDRMGMNRSADVYDIAKNCYQCHTVPIENVVNQAGHPTGNAEFEFVAWAQGELRHNFQMNQSVNAEAPTLWTDPLWNGAARTAQGRKRLMYVVGQLVDLEVSLRNRGAAIDKGAFATAAGKRVGAAQSNLQKIDGLVALPEVKRALEALKPITRVKLLIVKADDKPLYDAAADEVAAAAKALVQNHDGSQLAAVDALVPGIAKGQVFQP